MLYSTLDYKLAIIRVASSYGKYYKDLVEERNLAYEVLAEFPYVLVMNKCSPLAALPEIRQRDLRSLIEIVHGDPYIPSLPLSVVKKEELHEQVDRRLIMFDRASPFEVLSEKPDAYMWVSPIPAGKLTRYGLVQRKCPDYNRSYKDILIYRRDYNFTDLDQQFLDELNNSMNKCIHKDFE